MAGGFGARAQAYPQAQTHQSPLHHHSRRRQGIQTRHRHCSTHHFEQAALCCRIHLVEFKSPASIALHSATHPQRRHLAAIHSQSAMPCKQPSTARSFIQCALLRSHHRAIHNLLRAIFQCRQQLVTRRRLSHRFWFFKLIRFRLCRRRSLQPALQVSLFPNYLTEPDWISDLQEQARLHYP